jgi:hypothetical protein
MLNSSLSWNACKRNLRIPSAPMALRRLVSLDAMRHAEV